MNERWRTKARKLITWPGWGYALFWSWNLIFLAFMSLGFAPQILPEMMEAVRGGTIPVAFLVYAVILVLIPAVAVALGATALRRSPGKLLSFGYGVEGPLMLMLAIRAFAMREVTPALAMLLIVAGVGILTLLWQLVDRDIDEREPPLAHLRAVGLTLLLIVGVYVGIWVAFYALPIAARSGEILGNLFPRGFWHEIRNIELQWFVFWLLGFLLFLYSATLFVAMPIIVPILYIRAWARGMRSLTKDYGQSRAAALTTLTLLLCVLLFLGGSRQPQHKAFALLETPPASIEEAQVLLEQQSAIRVGLLNTYLASFRYISAVGEVYHVSALYEWAFDMAPDQAMRVQRLYELVARPMLYEPVDPASYASASLSRWENRALQEEPAKAAKLYKTFFDAPINEGERDAVVHAVRSTWSFDQAQQAWQAVDDREVHLLRQELNIAEYGDWAEVELYEVYQNQTDMREEVVYYFSLPESAVITGVWLGASADRAQRAAYRVAPRGAAQAVYRNEVRRNIDPALVEQIGPRQYRLRIFPIEPRNWRWEQDRRRIEDGAHMHMWLSWRVLASDAAWPMPYLAEKRNVYWDDASVRLLNGEPMAVDGDAWLPACVAALSPTQPVAHRVDFPTGESVILRPATAEDMPWLPRDLRLAVVLDRSRSMAAHADDVEAALAQLADLTGPGAAASGQTAIDIYLTASEYRGEAPSRAKLAALKPSNIVYYGGQNAAELLAQYDALHNGEAYDAIFVLTDGTGYELSDSDAAASLSLHAPDAPVWMVHLGGNFPLGYDDATLEAIQASGGGVVGDVETALTRLATAMALDPDAAQPGAPADATTDIFDGYLWTTLPTELVKAQFGNVVTVAPSDPFAAFAARQLILTTMHRQRGKLDALDTLDDLHAIAIEHSIVTPYSSMIVLVNAQQEKLLEDLSTQGDRFEREYEAVGETVPEPISVTGVPEPEEWLLLALAGGMLFWYAYKRRRDSQLFGL